MGNWRQGLKIELGGNKAATVLFNLTEEFYAALPSSSRKDLPTQAFFHNFASIQVNKCPLYGQMETGSYNRPRGNKAADSTL